MKSEPEGKKKKKRRRRKNPKKIKPRGEPQAARPGSRDLGRATQAARPGPRELFLYFSDLVSLPLI